MKQFFWNLLAKIVTIPFVTEWLIRQALKTPYTHIKSVCGTKTYMERYWLFNPYETHLIFKSNNSETQEVEIKKYKWLPSIRIHKIMEPDQDRHLHDHPWDMAKTIILRGWYVEEMLGCSRINFKGDVNSLPCGEFHRISEISPYPVMTLFFTWNFKEPWGFLVNGKKIHHHTYLKQYPLNGV